MTDVRKTIFVFNRGYSQEDLPVVKGNTGVSSVYFKIKYGINWNDTEMLIPNTPSNVKIFKPSSVQDRPELFYGGVVKNEHFEAELPDIFRLGQSTVVSLACRTVLEEADPSGGHEFIPTEIKSLEGKPFGTKRFFHFWCGRRVDVGYKPPRVDLPLPVSPHPPIKTTLSHGSDALARYRDPRILSFLADLPCWITTHASDTVYVIEFVFRSMQSAGLIGIEEFSERGGAAETDNEGFFTRTTEHVGHIFVDPI